MRSLKAAFKNLWRAKPPELPAPVRHFDLGHAVCDGAFRNRGDAERYKLAADATLPWLHDLTLSGHTMKEGMWQGFNGAMGNAQLSLLWQNGLIKACIDTTADEMTRNWIELAKEGATEVDDDIKRLEDACLKHDLRGLFNAAIRANELFGGCMIFIDTGAAEEDLVYPLHVKDWAREIRNFRGFKIIEPLNLFPGVYNSTNPRARDYFEPQTWWVLGTRVHASRLIKIQTSNLWQVLKPAYNFFGVPHAQILWDYVMHFQKCRIATATAATKFSRTILKTDAETLLAEDGGASMLKTRLAILADMNNDGMTAIDFEGEDIAQVNMPLTGLTDITWQGLEMLCVVNKSPAVKTLGVSPSGFSATGDSDFKNWYDHIKSKQERDIGAQVAKCLEILQMAELGRIDPAVGYEFKPLSEENLREKADTDKIRMDTIAQGYDINGIKEEEARELIKEIFPSIKADSPTKANEEAEADANKQDTSLNGAQIAGMSGIVSQVAQGEISRESGMNILMKAFPISREEAIGILGPEEFAPSTPEKTDQDISNGLSFA